MADLHHDNDKPVELDLETDRLLIRPFVELDWDLAQEIWTDPEVMKLVSDVSTEVSLPEDMELAIRRGAGGRLGVWCVTQRKTGEKLGTAILLPLPIEENDTDWSLLQKDGYPDAEIEIGYILKRAAWGRGYATEACRRLLRFAFEKTVLEEIVATTDPNNTASQSVLRKCGLRAEGLRRAYACDCSGFRITRPEWLARQTRGT